MDAGDSSVVEVRNGEDAPDILGFSSTSRRINKDIAQMVVHKDGIFYKMDHPHRGVAVIFNHEKFNITNLKDRSGTNADCDNLQATLASLGFEVVVHVDLSTLTLMNEVHSVAAKDHSETDCLVVCVLSHGEQGIIYAKDGAYKPEDLWSPFTAEKCKSLAGKPKLFFIQACQGNRLDGGIHVRTQVDSSPSYRIPVHADFLIAYSTIPGFYSWRNTTRGSWYVQALCMELKESGFKYDLLTLLTFVNRRVATDFESNVPGDVIMHAQKQIPCITSMLTRLVKFTEK